LWEVGAGRVREYVTVAQSAKYTSDENDGTMKGWGWRNEMS